MTILYALVSLGAFVCFVMVLIKLFQAKGVGHGILGIICGLYTFIWGWINADTLNIKQLMIIWTVLGLLAMALGYFVAPTLAPAIPQPVP